jgi:pimeloyl-ACP methyl ester carboxylesterase
VVELGNPRGDPLVFISGFPDDCLSPWASVLNRFTERYRVILMCLPEYDSSTTTRKKWGYSMDEIVKLMCKTIDEVLGDKQVQQCAMESQIR